MADHLARLPGNEARHEAATILANLPQELRSASQPAMLARWIGDPAAAQRLCEAAERRLIELKADIPSLRLLADKTAQAFAGIAFALNGLALLVVDPAQTIPPRGRNRLLVPDWLPPLVSAGRTFATIGAVSLFWIVTAWPGGALAITFAAIVALLLAPRPDETYGAAILFTVGAILDLILTAIVAFAVLPELRTDAFAALSLVMGVCLVPIGVLLRQARQPWQVGLFTAMTMGFVPILQPTNPETYDTQLFYNVGLAIVAGMSAAALSFRLLPPLSPAFRTRRLLSLTLRDLRRLAKGRTQSDWEGHVIARLSVMPNEATPLQRAQLLAAFSVGSEIIHLRHVMRQFGLGANLDGAFEAVAEGHSASAIERLSRLDEAFSADIARGPRNSRCSASARQHSCRFGDADKARRLFRCGSACMSFAEVDLFGVYVAPISLTMVLAWLVTIALRRVASRFGLLRYAWHPALFVFAVYIIVLSSWILIVAPRGSS